MKLYMGMRLRPLMFVGIIAMALFRESSIKGLTLLFSVGVVNLSGFSSIASIQLGMDYCPE